MDPVTRFKRLGAEIFCAVWPEGDRISVAMQRMLATTRLVCLMLAGTTAMTPAWQMLGPFGGSAQGVRVAPSQPATVVVYTRDAQLFVSHDRGEKWIPRPFPVEYQTVMHAFVIDPENPSRWLAGVEDESGGASGIYGSNDAGDTWTRTPSMAGKAVWSLAVSPAHRGLVIAGTADGVYRSTDHGDSWERISPEQYGDLRPVVSLAIDSRSADTIFAGTTHLPWRTTDGGKTWHSIHTGMLDDSDVFSVVINPGIPGSVYASACSGAYRSVNGGTRWARLPTPKGTFRTYVVAVDPTVPTTVYAGTSGGLLRSENEGRTWLKISGHAVYAIDFEPARAGRVYFASTTGGILTTDDHGKNLRELSKGFGNRQWVALVGTKSSLFAAAVENHGAELYKSPDLGRTWSKVTTAGIGDVRFLAASNENDTLYAATRKQVLKSEDEGGSWTPIGSAFSAATIDALTVGEADTILVAAGDRLYRSQGKKGWTALDARYSGRVRAAGASGSIIAVVARSGLAFSKDGGASWEPCRSPNAGIEWYDVAWTGQGHLLAATSHGMFGSPDCAEWSPVRGGLDASTVSTVFIDRTGNVLLAVQRGEVYRSNDSGATWTASGDTSGTRSMPSRLIRMPDSKDRIFGLFARRGVADLPLGREQQVSQPVNGRVKEQEHIKEE
ncbi:MAG TPA: hypothetical protein VEX68_27415 [Bryobacteraceae bacterium]|nr:hypothetical protein [Bryobacteraceae bacterium]